MLQLVAALALVAIILAVGLSVRRIVSKRAEALVGLKLERSAETPVVLYFKSTHCPPCRLEQEPELRTLAERSQDEFELRTIDVSLEPDLARQYRVLSAPTTVVLDVEGRVAAVNVGTAKADLLASQISASRQPAA